MRTYVLNESVDARVWWSSVKVESYTKTLFFPKQAWTSSSIPAVPEGAEFPKRDTSYPVLLNPRSPYLGKV
jgi:hypothetical protein